MPYSVDHSVDNLTTHVEPLGSLGVVAHIGSRIELAKDKREYVPVETLENICYQQTVTEGKQVPEWRKVHLKARAPWSKVPAHDCPYQHIHYALRCNAPIRETVKRQHYANSTRHHYREYQRNGLLLDLEFAEQIGRRCDTEPGHHKSQEVVAREPHQHRLAEEIGDKRRAKEQHSIHEQRYENIEPEDCIVVVMGHTLSVGYCCHETAVLQGTGYCREDGKHTYDAIVIGTKYTRQIHAEEKTEELAHHIAHAAPKEPLRDSMFQIAM